MAVCVSHRWASITVTGRVAFSLLQLLPHALPLHRLSCQPSGYCSLSFMRCQSWWEILRGSHTTFAFGKCRPEGNWLGQEHTDLVGWPDMSLVLLVFLALTQLPESRLFVLQLEESSKDDILEEGVLHGGIQGTPLWFFRHWGEMGLGLLYRLKMGLCFPQPGKWYPLSLPVGVFCLYPFPASRVQCPGYGHQSCPAGEWTWTC